MISNESKLVDGLRAKSGDAFRAAVAQFSGPMLATARAIAGAADAEDIVQEAWLTVYQKIDGFEGRSSLATWLHRIVTNRALSRLRKGSREISEADLPVHESGPDWFDDKGSWATPPPAWSASSPEALLTADELQGCLDKHLLLMPENQRAVLVMRDMQVLPFEEIGTTLELSTANVRVLLHRARTRLIAVVNRFQETGTC
jgi:RNA polymerase sigma-70 factor, ECF subfamily